MSLSPPPSRPTIGITMGDPLGIGPEVLVKALSDPRFARAARLVIYGQNQVLAWTAERLGVEPHWYRVAHDSDRATQPIVTDMVVLDFPEYEPVLGASPAPTRTGGLVSKSCVEVAIADALRPASDPRHIDAIVTGPICK